MQWEEGEARGGALCVVLILLLLDLGFLRHAGTIYFIHSGLRDGTSLEQTIAEYCLEVWDLF